MITIVSGLPRSGTTLMMRMLYYGGKEVISDNDYSFESGFTNRLHDYNSWLAGCEGKAVKVLHPKIFYINPTLEYKIIWMWRDWKEQAKSQSKYRKALGKPVSKKDIALRRKLNKRWHRDAIYRMKEQDNIEFIKVRFESCLRNPEHTAKAVNRFVGGLDEGLMAKAVIKRSSRNFKGFMENQLMGRAV